MNLFPSLLQYFSYLLPRACRFPLQQDLQQRVNNVALSRLKRLVDSHKGLDNLLILTSLQRRQYIRLLWHLERQWFPSDLGDEFGSLAKSESWGTGQKSDSISVLFAVAEEYSCVGFGKLFSWDPG